MNDQSASKGPGGDHTNADAATEAPLPLAEDKDSRAGELLRNAATAYRANLDESRAFRRLEERRQSAWQWRLGSAAAVVALAATATLLLRPASDSNSIVQPSVTAEAYPRRPQLDAPAAPSALETPRAEEPKVVKAPLSVATAPRKALPAPPGEAECQELVKSSKIDQSIDCFRGLAQSSGLSAEVGLYEVGRLELESRRDATSALRAFEEHRRRFPGGTLRGEVDYGIVRALAELGRTSQALAESEALLTKPWGRSIATELHLLRGRLFDHNLRDCGHALTEYVALVGDPSAAGDEAELGRARCLVSLGRREDAAQAYTQYLARPNPRSADVARQQLVELGGAP